MMVFIGILFVVSVFKIFSMIGGQEDRIDDICDRLSKIERDAIKITFNKKNEK
jgi:hypothetical protein